MARIQHVRQITDDGYGANVRAYLGVDDQPVLQIKTHTREFQIYLTGEEAADLGKALTEAAVEACKPWPERMARRYGPATPPASGKPQE